MENGAIDLSQEGAELKFKIDPDTGELPLLWGVVGCSVVWCGWDGVDGVVRWCSVLCYGICCGAARHGMACRGSVWYA